MLKQKKVRKIPPITVEEIEEAQQITAALAAPFALKDVRHKPQTVKNNKALALAYVDVRVIQDRLDEVLGVDGWQDEYQLLPDNSVMCKLRLRIGRRWITKMDVGSPSEQPDGGDRLKAAFSDALKRAAVKFGVGRYLYRLPAQWVEYDPVKRQFTRTPTLPAFAQPRPKPTDKPGEAVAASIAPAPPIAPVERADAESKTVPAAASTPSPLPTPAAKPNLPTDGKELHRRLRDYDGKLSRQGLCQVGALLAHVTQAGVKAGYPADISSWAGPAIGFAVETTKAFEAELRATAQSTAKAIA